MKKMIALASALALMGTAGAAMAGGAQDTYMKTCNACHGTGAAGAPKLGDAAAWKDRIAQGNAVLYNNSIKGFKGKTGMMPPKGGFANLSDDEVKAAVDYMVSKSK